MRNSIFLFLLFFASGLNALPVMISGDAASYPGRNISVLVVEDEFSQKRKALAVAEISSQGKFKLDFDLSETRKIVIRVNRVEAVMYAEPGHSYEVKFPADATASIKRFDKTEVELEFVDLPESDLNILIRRFNADFADFISEHYYDFAVGEYVHADAWLKTRTDARAKVDLFKPQNSPDSVSQKIRPEFNKYILQFKVQTDQNFGASENQFLNDYIEYSLAEIDILSGLNRKTYYKKYLMSRKLPLDNPAFARSFELFYNGFLSKHPSEIQNRIIKAINIDKNFDVLVGLFENDSTCLSVSVRTLAIINALEGLYIDKTYQRKSIEKTLSSLTIEDGRLKSIAANVASQLQRRREDFEVENFVCLDGRMDKWQLHEHNDHYLYILFFASWSPNSIKELQMMQKWHEKYGRHIEFIAVCMDDDYKQYKEMLATYKDYKFEILFGNADPLLAEKAMVFSIPEAMMLNENGRTMYAHTKKPSEGIQLDFEKIMQSNIQSGKGPKTWKDSSK